MMELDENLPDRVRELFEEETPDCVEVGDRTLNSQSVCLHGSEDAVHVGFTRILGMKVIEQTGYAVTGVRQHDGYIEVWFDPIDNVDEEKHMTVAQRAARCLEHKENDTRFEANVSDDPKQQYVDVFPEPHERASEDYSLTSGDMERLRSEGLKIRMMSCGRTRSPFNDEEYRIWFDG